MYLFFEKKNTPHQVQEKKKSILTHLKRNIPFYLTSLNCLTITKFEQIMAKYIDKTSIKFTIVIILFIFHTYLIIF